jgi:rhodanese-related sulfurtransferase
VKKSKIMARKLQWRSVWIAIASLLISCSSSPFTLSVITTKIERDYPRVRHISTTTLAQWLKQPNPPILLDVREAEEFAVSHLQGADNVIPDTPIPVVVETILKDVKKKQQIVVYCSVGYRSAQFAQKLQEAGFSNIYNLKGSIFAWANEARPLYHGSVKVQQVHPYNQQWGQLLDAKYRAPLEY